MRAQHLPRLFAQGSEPTILVTTVILVGVAGFAGRLPSPLGSLLLIVFVLLWGTVLVFFRDPERVIPEDERLILAPADGELVAIDNLDEPVFVRGPALRVSTFMSLWNVHVNRSPVEGEVRLVRHMPGRFLQAFRPEASDVNEHTLIGIRAGKQKVLVKQIAGIMARRCVNYAQVGTCLERGQRIGLIRFGSRVDLFLPPDTRLQVQVGDKVRAGSSILGQWPSCRRETE